MFEDVGHIERLLTEKIAGRRVLVVGDLMLDRYLWGTVDRISPEAPIPVVKLTGRSESPGGAANVAGNLAGLGVRVVLSGIVGADRDGDRLLSLLGEKGIDTGAVCRTADAPTTVKTRVIVQHNQLLRIDEEDGGAAGSGNGSALAAALEKALADKPDAVVVSDYAKGAVSASLVEQLISSCRQRSIPVFIDPKGSRWEKYRGATCITPNYKEFCEAAGGEPESESSLLEQARRLKTKLDLKALVITRGGQGITHIGERELTVPAAAREVFDVSGAGDTVVAVLTVAEIAGLDAEQSLQLANLAAGVVIGKVGTVPITSAELVAAAYQLKSFDSTQKLCGTVELLEKVEIWRRGGMTVGLARGAFDPLATGFIDKLERLRGKCGRLILLYESAAVDERARLFAALSSIDVVTAVPSPEAARLEKEIGPDVSL